MLRKLLSMALALLLLPAFVLAQGSITGTVSDAATGETLPGANVVVQELNRGAATDTEGRFVIDNVPNGTYTLTSSFVGYKKFETTVEVSGSETTLNIELEPDYFGLEEVVVTGVGTGTQTTKLGFSVGKVGEKQLSQVTAADPANALRGKVSGVTIVQASGDPSAAPDIRLRGSTSITGDQSPLIIVDGVITSGSLRDINMEDVKSIEVVKGAAAASIYGSLAGNGVIQIITKRNADKVDEPQFTIRSEYGFSEIADKYPIATKHPFINDATLTSGGQYVDTWPGYENYDSDRRFDNDFPVLYDNVEALFTGKPFNTNNFSLANSGEDYNYMASFENFNQGGVLEPVEDYVRNTVRLNADYTPNDKLAVNFSASYINVDSPRFEEQGQGDNFFYSVLTAMPFMDLTEKNEDGEFSNDPTGYDIQGSNFQNPLYVAEQRDFQFNRDRIIAGAKLQYKLTDWLSANGRQSLDKSYRQNTTFYPKGYITPTPSASINDGYESRTSIVSSAAITELWLDFQKEFDDYNVNAIVKYLYEDRNFERFSAEGSNYVVAGIRDIGDLTQNQEIDSYQQTIRAENIFLNVDVDYQDKIIASGLIRRDGSSMFGSEERWQTYYRGSVAYRITEDVDINNINEWKVRASYGTSGNRPPFEAQYETFSASQSGISPNILGNNEIKPSTVAEMEVGTNITFFDRYNAEINYAMTTTTNDYLLVPLSSVAGYNAQWQNIGEIESTSFEVALNGQFYNTQDLSWSAGLTFDKTTQEITDLGDVPPFTRNIGGSALPLFRVEAGVPYGAMYGNLALTSLDQLTVVNGEVVNSGVDVNGDGQLTTADYEVNSHGYVVPKGTHGTVQEQITYQVDENGEKTVSQIGNTTPDFQMGLSNTLNYKGVGLYILLDWSRGQDVYNYTKQLLYFNNRHKDLQDFAAQGFDVGYADGSSQIYNGASASSYFVEDASFIKLREVALSYTLAGSKLGTVGDYVDEIRLSVTGRNLLTFTDYTGWDPEVALRTNATNFRLDEYAYPNYRTYTGSIQIRF